MFKENFNLKTDNQESEVRPDDLENLNNQETAEDQPETAELQRLREQKVEDYLYNNHLIVNNNGKLEFDLEAIKNLKTSAIGADLAFHF